MNASDHSDLSRLHRELAGFHKVAHDTCIKIAEHHSKLAGHQPSPSTFGEAARRGQQIEPGEGFGDIAQRTAAASVSVAKGHYGDGAFGDDDPSGGLRKALH